MVVTPATFTVTAQNWVRWINADLRLFDPEMMDNGGSGGQNLSITEHVPPPAILTASLRVVF